MKSNIFLNFDIFVNFVFFVNLVFLSNFTFSSKIVDFWSIWYSCKVDIFIKNWRKYQKSVILPIQGAEIRHISISENQRHLGLCMVRRVWRGIFITFKLPFHPLANFCAKLLQTLKKVWKSIMYLWFYSVLLGWRIFMEFKKSASSKADERPQVSWMCIFNLLMSKWSLRHLIIVHLLAPNRSTCVYD